MHWEYQTMLFEFRKDGLLGDKYIDDEEVENILNEQGKLEWELVSVTPVQEGLLAFLKKEIRPVMGKLQVKSVDVPLKEEQVEEESVKNREHEQVRDGELVSRSDRRNKQHGIRSENDLIGGIRIS